MMLIITSSTLAWSQNDPAIVDVTPRDSLTAIVDSAVVVSKAMSKKALKTIMIDSARIAKSTKPKRDWTTWRPDPKRSLWLALVIPGAGQIYNRKYWKLPIFYGGFIGCIYAMSWNNMMYKSYSQAYVDIMDSDPGTQSYNKFMHLGQQITESNKARWTGIFKSRKDKYRRWRDMSLFVMIGVYALSVIDAYVDAELSEFDISNDLSLKVKPTIMNNGTTSFNPIESSSIGVQCKLNF